MKILNAMFSKVNGGVEQVFLNYITALMQQGNDVISVIHPWAEIKKQCTEGRFKTIYSFGRNDYIAVRRLKKLIETEQPSCIISHTKRAALLIHKTKTTLPKIAICHTPQSYKELEEVSDYVITVTEHMYKELINAGFSSDKMVFVSNMIPIAGDLQFRKPKNSNIPVIGVSARFSLLKGIDVFIDSLAILKKRNISFKARIAGDGKEKNKYIQLIEKYQLKEDVEFLGWIDDTQAFYKSLDLFCHPSLKESFGLVVVESMMHSIPMVLTDVSGPREIIGDTQSAVMVPPSDPESMANGLEQLIQDRDYAQDLAYRAFQRVQSFSINTIGPKLHQVLEERCCFYQSN